MGTCGKPGHGGYRAHPVDGACHALLPKGGHIQGPRDTARLSSLTHESALSQRKFQKPKITPNNNSLDPETIIAMVVAASSSPGCRAWLGGLPPLRSLAASSASPGHGSACWAKRWRERPALGGRSEGHGGWGHAAPSTESLGSMAAPAGARPAQQGQPSSPMACRKRDPAPSPCLQGPAQGAGKGVLGTGHRPLALT